VNKFSTQGLEMEPTLRPIAIDLFSGAGGLSLGFEQAGFDVAAAVEIDPVHAAVHEYNFPACRMLVRTVAGLSGNEIRSRAGIGGKRVDVVCGGPPCQGFSMIGHRMMDDPRNSLVAEFVRIVAELEASYFVFENVKGLTVGSHRKFLEEVIDDFGRFGYQVRAPWRVLNAMHHGVPQNRQRLILFGARRGLPLPEYPRAEITVPTCAAALADLPDSETFDDLWSSDEVRIPDWPEITSTYARQMRCQSNDPWYFGYPRDWDPHLLTSSARTEHTDISRRRFSETKGGDVEPISRFFKLSAEGVANTLRAGTDSARGAFTSPRPIHFAHARCVTVREMARLHGFPDWFRLHATKWHGARQVGNAVPPPLARSVASEVIAAIGTVPTRPTAVEVLGAKSLLQMTSAEAAAYFGVPAPFGRRDRKSGAKKRKQADIENVLAASAA